VQEPLSLPFLKKFIAFAKQRFATPELSPEASDAIAGGWVGDCGLLC
jgi:DNA replicative helicase MCM subunit Mcm2 (Cdc46/Mcm family)